MANHDCSQLAQYRNCLSAQAALVEHEALPRVLDALAGAQRLAGDPLRSDAEWQRAVARVSDALRTMAGDLAELGQRGAAALQLCEALDELEARTGRQPRPPRQAGHGRASAALRTRRR